MNEAATTRPTNRRWFQFNLRAMLLLLSLIAVIAAVSLKWPVRVHEPRDVLQTGWPAMIVHETGLREPTSTEAARRLALGSLSLGAALVGWNYFRRSHD